MSSTHTKHQRTVGLVLAGAVTKGAFEAGVLKVVAERGITVRRIVAASSGALNGIMFAAGVRARRELSAALELIETWEREGGFCDVVDVNLRSALGGRGLSDQRKLLRLLRRHVRPTTRPDPAPIELHFIVAPVLGKSISIGKGPATTYMRILSFADEQFDREESLSDIYRAATASAALPVLYTPVDIPGLGNCIDGGLVNNTPIANALGADQGASLDAVLVAAATPAMLPPTKELYRGQDLIAHVIDMVFSEWLVQDLIRALRKNEDLRRLEALAAQKGWGQGEIEEIKAAVSLGGKQIVPIVPIRPFAPLPGTLFSGFADPAIRRRWIQAGVERANQALDELGWT